MHVDVVEHCIDTGDGKPIKTFRIGSWRRNWKIDFIEPSTSSYASALMLVHKKDGSL